MKINFLKILAIAALMIFIGAGVSLADGWKGDRGQSGARVWPTPNIGSITITTTRRPGQFMWSVIIGRLLSIGTIIRRLCIMRLRRQAGSSLGCQLRMQGRRLGVSV